jgi:uncharacterized protein YbbC (DUF1343 family)
MKLGIEVFLNDKKWQKKLKGQRLALVCHPASVDQNLKHSFDLIQKKYNLACAFGPQHGVKGDKQYNMMETLDEKDARTGIPIYSLYGEVRKPKPQQMQGFDVMIFDLQDLGCRIYTFITTLLYVMQACAEHGKTLIVLDRPNPIGRGVEGLALEPGHESFVGAAPIPMRHGLTMAEMALFYKEHFNLELELHVVRMQGYKPKEKPGFGWPSDLSWVNPSPNAATLNMARCYPGTVLIEGTHLSEGRGTTRPLEVVGSPQLDFGKILQQMKKMDLRGAQSWLQGLNLRECFFEPTFYKNKGELCHGIMIHADSKAFNPLKARPFRVVALMLKALRTLYPEYDLYRNFTYEYVADRLAFDVINGGSRLREWIEDSNARVSDLDKVLRKEETSWMKQSKKYWLY